MGLMPTVIINDNYFLQLPFICFFPLFRQTMQTEISTQIWIKLEALLMKTSEKKKKRVPQILANGCVSGSITHLKADFFPWEHWIFRICQSNVAHPISYFSSSKYPSSYFPVTAFILLYTSYTSYLNYTNSHILIFLNVQELAFWTTLHIPARPSSQVTTFHIVNLNNIQRLHITHLVADRVHTSFSDIRGALLLAAC